MSVKSGQSVTVLFATSNYGTGTATDADALPVGTLYVNGTANGATVTETNITTGVYKASVTLPTLSAGDMLAMRVTYAVDSVATEHIIWQDVADTAYADDLSNEIAANLAAIGAIGVASGTGLNYGAEDDNVDGPIGGVTLVGTQTSGTYASTEAEDGVRHQITHTGDAIDVVYQFNVSGIRKSIQAIWKGYLTGSNDTMTVQAYDYVGSDWETRYTFSGSVGTSNVTHTITLLSKHTGTGANAGKVLLRFVCSAQSSPVLNTDAILVEAAIASQSVGYADGAIWVDTNASNENTTPFVDGVADNPVSTWSAALSLATSLGMKKFHIAGGSSVTLTGDSSNYEIYGTAYELALGGQTITNAEIVGARVTGIGVTSGTAPVFEYCGMGAVTLGACRLYQCGIGRSAGQFTGGSAGQFVIVDCFSLVAGSGTPVLVFSGLGSTTGINVRGWKGGVSYTLDSDCVLSHEVLAGGGTTIVTGGASCEIRGTCRAVTVTVSGSETVQFVGTTGPITLNGTATATINLYGVSSSLTDNTTGCTVTNKCVSRDTVNLEADTALADYDPPTDTEMIARTLPAADYLVEGDTLARVTLVDTTTTNTDMVTEPPTAVQVRQEMDANSTQLADIVADTAELQTDDVPGLIATAQADLDLLTGTDGATLATAQGNYAPAKAGAEMDLVDAPNSTAVTAIQSGLSTVTTAQVNEQMLDVLTVDTLADSVAADGAQPTIGQALYAIQQYLFERAVSGTTVTIKKPDGSTSLMTFTLDDDTTPTAQTRAS